MNNKKRIITLLLSIVLIANRPVKAIETKQVIAVAAITVVGYGLLKYKPWRYFYRVTKLEQAQKIIEKIQNHDLMYDYCLSDQRRLKKIIDYFRLKLHSLDKAQLFFENVLHDLQQADLLLSSALRQEGDSSRCCIIHHRKQVYFLEKRAKHSLAIIQERQSLEEKERAKKIQQAKLVRLKNRILHVSDIRAVRCNYQDKELYEIIKGSFSGNKWPLIEAKSYFTTLSSELRVVFREFSLLLRADASLYDEIASAISQIQVLIDRVSHILRVIEHPTYEYVAQEQAYQLHLAYQRQLAFEREEAARRRRQENARLQRIRDEELRLEREREEFWYQQRRQAAFRKKVAIIPVVEVVQVETHIHQPQPVIQPQPTTTIIIEKEAKSSVYMPSNKQKKQLQKQAPQKLKKVEKSKEASVQAEPQDASEKTFQSRWEEALFDSFDQF